MIVHCWNCNKKLNVDSFDLNKKTNELTIRCFKCLHEEIIHVHKFFDFKKEGKNDRSNRKYFKAE